MDLYLLPIDQIQSFLIVLCRVAGFVAAIPVFMSNQAPMQIRVGLAFSCALVLYPLMQADLPPIKELTTPDFMLLVLTETLVGIIIGFIANIIFTAVEFGATVIGYQMGFAAANVFDPQGERQVALLSQFQNVFAILIFIAIDGHHSFLETALISYQYLPPGEFNYGGGVTQYIVQLVAHMFVIGVQFSAPILAVLLLSGLVLGILARIFAQLNVFMLSFPLNIAIGFIVIALTMPLLSVLITREFNQLPERILNILSLLAK